MASAPLLDAQRARYVGGGTARIYYDAAMVPHVFGSDDEAALFGLGYHHMIDFPIGTLNMLWLHSGRMAEVAGQSYLDEDRLIRLWEVPEVARRYEKELEEEGLLPLIEAYVRGVEAGREWWRAGGAPSASPRLDALLGEDLEVWVDPVPDYLNPAFSPFGAHDDPDVPLAMRAVVDRMFDAGQPITVEHVLHLGAAIQSFFLMLANPFKLDRLPTAGPQPPLPTAPRPIEGLGSQVTSQSTKASNSWMASSAAAAGSFLTLSDGHVALNKLHIRPYFVHVRGDRYRASGLTMPGYPAVYAGYNDALSWLFTAPPGGPVARNQWRVKLEPSADPTSLEFEFDLGGAVDLVALEKVVETLAYFDPDTGGTASYVDVRYYVPLHPAESEELGFARYPVIPEAAAAPLPGDSILFEQASFRKEGCPWEFFLRMGRARNARGDVEAILQDVFMIFGNGLNLMVADRGGSFRYLWMGRYPIQGAAVPSSEFDEGAELDGARLDWRWEGMHELEDLPAIGPVDVSGTDEVWIQNNVTPDLVETWRFDTGDLAGYPEYIVPHESSVSWRQLRADELLRGSPPLSQATSEAIACDVRNQWMHLMWPFYALSATFAPAGISADALALVQWIEEHRGHDEQDQPGPGHDFEAHPFSQATVYAVLLRSHYLDELGRLDAAGGLSEEQASLGHDAAHPLLSDPSGFDEVAFGPNVDAFVHALETVAALWKEGTGPAGLVNQAFLASISPSLPGDPWGDARYSTDVAPQWQGTVAGDKVTRWGHVNMSVLTPHFLPPPKKTFVDGVPGRGGDAFSFIRGYVGTGLWPPLLQGLPYDNLKVPFYDQLVRVWPMRGVRSSLFTVSHFAVFGGSPPAGYQESVYGWTPTELLDWHPQTTGSQTLLSVRLAPGRPARGRFLAAFGGTEITRPDLLGDGTLAYQRRFAPADEFATGKWQSLVLSERSLGAPVHELAVGREPLVPVQKDL